VAATGAGNTDPALLTAAEAAMADGIPVAVVTRCAAGAAGTGYAFPGGGATWLRAGALFAGHLTGPKARIALALGIGVGLDRDGLAALPRRSGPDPRSGPVLGAASTRGCRRVDLMPLDMLVSGGRIATLAGDQGFGWVEAVGITDGRIAFAGSAVDLETRADPFTRRIELDPDEVAIPGLTDAHLHLAEGGLSLDRIDLSTLADARPRLARPTRCGTAPLPAHSARSAPTPRPPPPVGPPPRAPPPRLDTTDPPLGARVLADRHSTTRERRPPHARPPPRRVVRHTPPRSRSPPPHLRSSVQPPRGLARYPARRIGDTRRPDARSRAAAPP
jgi:hypothetical protein